MTGIKSSELRNPPRCQCNPMPKRSLFRKRHFLEFVVRFIFGFTILADSMLITGMISGSFFGVERRAATHRLVAGPVVLGSVAPFAKGADKQDDVDKLGRDSSETGESCGKRALIILLRCSY